MSAQRARNPSELKPVTGTYTVPRALRQTAVPSHVFDIAFRNAVEKATQQWGPTNQVTVDIQYRARIDIWNPGGVGWCSVKLTPTG
jgi:LytS/YehU family sensor histidine kinase